MTQYHGENYTTKTTLRKGYWKAQVRDGYKAISKYDCSMTDMSVWWAYYILSSAVQMNKCISSQTVHSHNLSITHHFGFKWRLDLFVGQALPVNASKESLLSDVPLTLWAAAETLWWVFGHQLVTEEERLQDVTEAVCAWRKHKEQMAKGERGENVFTVNLSLLISCVILHYHVKSIMQSQTLSALK